jgi:hypothetical protein
LAKRNLGLAVRHRLYVHLVWTTRGRERLINLELARFLCRFLRAMARKERSYVLEIDWFRPTFMSWPGCILRCRSLRWLSDSKVPALR